MTASPTTCATCGYTARMHVVAGYAPVCDAFVASDATSREPVSDETTDGDA